MQIGELTLPQAMLYLNHHRPRRSFGSLAEARDALRQERR